MYVQYFSVNNQQKITAGIKELGMINTAQWFSKFNHKENTIVKIELSSIDIEKIFNNRLFFKNELTKEQNCVYEELILEDILDWTIFFPNKVKKMQLGHPIVLKRKLDHDNLHNSIYCFKGTLKAINKLMAYNKLAWSSKNNRTDEENKIISIMKNGHCKPFYVIVEELEEKVSELEAQLPKETEASLKETLEAIKEHYHWTELEEYVQSIINNKDSIDRELMEIKTTLNSFTEENNTWTGIETTTDDYNW